ncbi:hypothetical protein [Kitasatospora sp. MBT63]|uniref:hypothetical protein n=1 Tax=Kitasatospora sp. MBT63 TaxID=1444768 RepID=UPI00068DFEED|nr:hypothetical protein [Kitasatospora sp. MBT63]
MKVTIPWIPLSYRDGGTAPLREDVSAALEAPLREWLHTAVLRHGGGVWQRVAIRCDLLLETDDGFDHSEIDYPERLAYWTPVEQLLDAIDALLDLLPVPVPTVVHARPATPTADFPKAGGLLDMAAGVSAVLAQQGAVSRTPLQQLLDDARSRYTVGADGRGLVTRIDPAVARTLQAAVKSADRPERGSASEHLHEAITQAYALTPAYSEAIKAVESAAHTTVQPNHARATLGTMLGEMPKIAPKLVFEIEGADPQNGIEMVRRMMLQLWDGQTSRHGKQRPTRKETPSEAKTAVHLAAVLVQYFGSGAIRRA